MHRSGRVAFIAPLALAMLSASVIDSAAQQQAVRFLPDVVGQFNALSRRPDPMGFEIGAGPDPSMCRHHQALNRTEAADGTPYFYVSRSGPPRDFCPEEELGFEGNPIGNLYIVRMGSRDRNGERLRSNRLRKGITTTLTPPDPEDRVVRSIMYDGTTADWPHYDHPGGMQQVGNILAVGIEFPPQIYDPFPFLVDDPAFPKALVQFIDVSDPENPDLRSTFVPLDPDDPTIPVKAGVAALTPCGAGRVGVPCATGHYLLALSGGSDNGVVIFFESNGSDLSAEDLWWTPIYKWRKAELSAGDWHAHQTLMFLREGDLGGALFLAGARGGRFDPDMIDLYRVEMADGAVQIAQVASRHLISHPAGEGENAGARIAAFAAASTFYVSPSGELIFYASEHDNDGPVGTDDRHSIKMGEWRHLEMVRPDSPTLAPSIAVGGPYVVDEGGSVQLTGAGGPPVTKAWIQLFENEEYNDRNVIVDYDDWAADDFDDFRLLDPGFFGDTNGASDEATSWRWFAPVGCSIRANDDDFGDSDFPGTGTRTLFGSGGPRRDADLHFISDDGGTGNVNDSFTSLEFRPNCDDYYAAAIALRWDLNLDGTPETVGDVVTFAATEVDGPGAVGVPVSAIHPFDGLQALASASIKVNNLAPVIGSAGAFDRLGRPLGGAVPFVLVGQPVTVRAAFTDAGRLDHQTASLLWGDGATDTTFALFSDAFGGQTGQLAHDHIYATFGTYDIALDVTDDDLGTVRAALQVRVVTPEQAVGEIIDMLDALIAATTNPDARARLIQARKALAGDVIGFGSNGVLHKLEEDQDAAAISHMQNALVDLERAGAAGADVAALIALIQEVIAALAD